jgi:hypothetical protein
MMHFGANNEQEIRKIATYNEPRRRRSPAHAGVHAAVLRFGLSMRPMD